MVKIGFLFPGQGSQSVGMGKAFYDAYSCAKAVYDEASEVVGYDVAKLCSEGPEETLTQTINAQIAIFTTSIAILRVLQEQFPQLVPSVSCGLSLGEYSALVSSGVFDLATALRVVKARGELMEKAARATAGGMVSIIGLDEAACVALAEDCMVDVANYNSPEQIVLSGPKDRIPRVAEEATKRGAKKAVVLNVSGAFHSRLMAPAAEGMKQVLAGVTLAQPETLFIPNVKGIYESQPEAIKHDLIEQVSHSVKWTHSMTYAINQGITQFIEIGIGRVLKGLARRIHKEASVITIEEPKDLEEVTKLMEVSA